MLAAVKPKRRSLNSANVASKLENDMLMMK